MEHSSRGARRRPGCHAAVVAGRLCGCALAALALVACGHERPRSYTGDSFSADSPYRHKVPAAAGAACAAARRVLLGDGYLIVPAEAGSVKGRKAWRSEGDRSIFLEMSAVCLEDAAGSTVYASGMLSTYEVKKSGVPASVGVSAIGSLSLPFGQGVDSMVRTADETITERDFYRRFFRAVDAVLGGGTAAPGGDAAPGRESPQK